MAPLSTARRGKVAEFINKFEQTNGGPSATSSPVPRQRQPPGSEKELILDFGNSAINDRKRSDPEQSNSIYGGRHAKRRPIFDSQASQPPRKNTRWSTEDVAAAGSAQGEPQVVDEFDELRYTLPPTPIQRQTQPSSPVSHPPLANSAFTDVISFLDVPLPRGLASRSQSIDNWSHESVLSDKVDISYAYEPAFWEADLVPMPLLEFHTAAQDEPANRSPTDQDVWCEEPAFRENPSDSVKDQTAGPTETTEQAAHEHMVEHSLTVPLAEPQPSVYLVHRREPSFGPFESNNMIVGSAGKVTSEDELADAAAIDLVPSPVMGQKLVFSITPQISDRDDALSPQLGSKICSNSEVDEPPLKPVNIEQACEPVDSKVDEVPDITSVKSPSVSEDLSPNAEEPSISVLSITESVNPQANLDNESSDEIDPVQRLLSECTEINMRIADHLSCSSAIGESLKEIVIPRELSECVDDEALLNIVSLPHSLPPQTTPDDFERDFPIANEAGENSPERSDDDCPRSIGNIEAVEFTKAEIIPPPSPHDETEEVREIINLEPENIGEVPLPSEDTDARVFDDQPAPEDAGQVSSDTVIVDCSSEDLDRDNDDHQQETPQGYGVETPHQSTEENCNSQPVVQHDGSSNIMADLERIRRDIDSILRTLPAISPSPLVTEDGSAMLDLPTEMITIQVAEATTEKVPDEDRVIEDNKPQEPVQEDLLDLDVEEFDVENLAKVDIPDPIASSNDSNSEASSATPCELEEEILQASISPASSRVTSVSENGHAHIAVPVDNEDESPTPICEPDQNQPLKSDLLTKLEAQEEFSFNSGELPESLLDSPEIQQDHPEALPPNEEPQVVTVVDEPSEDIQPDLQETGELANEAERLISDSPADTTESFAQIPESPLPEHSDFLVVTRTVSDAEPVETECIDPLIVPDLPEVLENQVERDGSGASDGDANIASPEIIVKAPQPLELNAETNEDRNGMSDEQLCDTQEPLEVGEIIASQTNSERIGFAAISEDVEEPQLVINSHPTSRTDSSIVQVAVGLTGLDDLYFEPPTPTIDDLTPPIDEPIKETIEETLETNIVIDQPHVDQIREMELEIIAVPIVQNSAESTPRQVHRFNNLEEEPDSLQNNEVIESEMTEIFATKPDSAPVTAAPEIVQATWQFPDQPVSELEEAVEEAFDHKSRSDSDSGISEYSQSFKGCDAVIRHTSLADCAEPLMITDCDKELVPERVSSMAGRQHSSEPTQSNIHEPEVADLDEFEPLLAADGAELRNEGNQHNIDCVDQCPRVMWSPALEDHSPFEEERRFRAIKEPTIQLPRKGIAIDVARSFTTDGRVNHNGLSFEDDAFTDRNTTTQYFDDVKSASPSAGDSSRRFGRWTSEPADGQYASRTPRETLENFQNMLQLHQESLRKILIENRGQCDLGLNEFSESSSSSGEETSRSTSRQQSQGSCSNNVQRTQQISYELIPRLPRALSDMHSFWLSAQDKDYHQRQHLVLSGSEMWSGSDETQRWRLPGSQALASHWNIEPTYYHWLREFFAPAAEINNVQTHVVQRGRELSIDPASEITSYSPDTLLSNALNTVFEHNIAFEDKQSSVDEMTENRRRPRHISRRDADTGNTREAPQLLLRCTTGSNTCNAPHSDRLSFLFFIFPHVCRIKH